MTKLRVLDFGDVSPLRSQTLWHALDGAALAFCRPDAPYVSLGYHRSRGEVVADPGVPVFRRMIGGGPVWCDPGQLFFQVVMPARDVPFGGARAMAHLLAPAVEAFRDCGIDATLDAHGDISAGDSKISGVGGGQIRDVAVAVGNLIQRFDHDAAARILRIEERDRLTELMRRYVRPTPVEPRLFVEAMTRRCAEAFRLRAVPGSMTPAELDRLGELDRRFADPVWPDRSATGPRVVKVRGGVFFAEGRDVVLTVVGGRIDAARVRDPELHPLAIELAGRAVAQAAAVARDHGARIVADELEAIERRAS